MKNIKHDYEALKIEFFTSEHKTVGKFYREKFGKNMSWSVRKQTTGWTKDKKDYKENGLKDAIQEAKNTMAKWVRPLVQELEEKLANIMKLVDLKIKGLYENAFEIVYDKYGEVIYKTDAQGNYLVDKTGARIPMRTVSANISATEINRLYDMVKTELWEPAKIHNSRLSDMEGKDLPPITGIKVEIIENKKNKKK